MFNKKFFVILLVIVVVAFCIGFFTSGRETANMSAQQEQTVVQNGADTAGQFAVNILSASQGGVAFAVNKAVADLLGEAGYKTAVRITGSTRANIEGILKNEGQLAVANSARVLQAYNGMGEYENQPPAQELQALMSMWVNYWQIITRADSDIATLYDLPGKRIAIDERHSDADSGLRAILAGCGVVFDENYLIYNSLPVALADLKAGNCDAVFMIAMLNNDRMAQVKSLDFEVKLIPIEAGDFDKLNARHPYYFHTVLPKESYDFLTADLPTMATVDLMLASKGVSDDEAYDMLAKIDAGRKTLAGRNGMLKTALFNADWSLNSGLPFHPGAVKYYNEHAAVEAPETAAVETQED